MLCYAMPCYAMPCYAMLCYAMLCYAMLCCDVPCYAMLCYAMLCCAMPCYAMLCYAVLCYAARPCAWSTARHTCDGRAKVCVCVCLPSEDRRRARIESIALRARIGRGGFGRLGAHDAVRPAQTRLRREHLQHSIA